MHSSMANLNLGQDVANKKEKINIAGHNSGQAVGMCPYGSLININPSKFDKLPLYATPLLPPF